MSNLDGLACPINRRFHLGAVALRSDDPGLFEPPCPGPEAIAYVAWDDPGKPGGDAYLLASGAVALAPEMADREARFALAHMVRARCLQALAQRVLAQDADEGRGLTPPAVPA